jgi:hypothetical protein
MEHGKRRRSDQRALDRSHARRHTHNEKIMKRTDPPPLTRPPRLFLLQLSEDDSEDPLCLLRYVLSEQPSASVGLSKVGSLLKDAKGWPWNKLYKDKHGTRPSHPSAFPLPCLLPLLSAFSLSLRTFRPPLHLFKPKHPSFSPSLLPNPPSPLLPQARCPSSWSVTPSTSC